MALKATIYKANLQIADMDRDVYLDHAVTIARHPSETDERMMVRLLALALNLPSSDANGTLELAKDLWDVDEPAMWHKDLTGQIQHWIEVGQPDDRRLLKAAGRADQVDVYSFGSSTSSWWSSTANKISRAPHITAWWVEPEQSQALAGLTQRTMQLTLNIQDSLVFVGSETGSIEISPRRLSANT